MGISGFGPAVALVPYRECLRDCNEEFQLYRTVFVLYCSRIDALRNFADGTVPVLSDCI